ncbi:serine hydrolase [uncultured Maricaulis sp.]|uniref:serine hydrolase domain-containing protein n=1 Tax=uncultured Maricaulis sp. TaxID=174710 RepID=UPI002613D352|nr:serine hydrolase domain-containing protein [uncultured Maricaulis sp.]
MSRHSNSPRNLAAGAAFVLALIVPNAFACTQLADSLDRADAFMENTYGGTNAGAAIMVMDGDTTSLSAYGMADIEWQQPNTTDTSFRIGSISKPLTALAVLQLAEEGRLDLGQPVGHYLPDLPDQLGAPSVRDLLSHMSGLPDHFALPSIPQIMRNPIAPDAIVALMADAELQFEPGQRWAYSNFNYVLLAQLVAARDPQGRPYETVLNERIFDPAGMDDAHYDRQAAIIPRRAAGYDHDGDTTVNTITAETSLAHGAGSLMASAEDMLAFTQALRDNRLARPDTLASAWQSRTTPDNEETGYGLGFNVGEFLGERAIWHTGSINGFQSVWMYLPDSGRAVAILSNGYYLPNVTTSACRILADLAGQPVPDFAEQALDEAYWRPFEGRYRLEDGSLLQLHVQDGIRYNLDNGRWRELAWAGGRLLYWPDSLAHLQFTASPEADGSVLTYVGPLLDSRVAQRDVGALEGIQVSTPLNPEESRSLVGRWEMASGDIFTIRAKDDGLTLQLPGQPPAAIHRSGPRTYFQRSAPISLILSETGDRVRINLYGSEFDLVRAD